MAPKSQQQLDHERLLERLQLCSLVVQEVHLHLEKPQDPEKKADILLAVEDLTGEILDLLKTTKYYVWGSDDLLS
jgi:hypothetical protein